MSDDAKPIITPEERATRMEALARQLLEELRMWAKLHSTEYPARRLLEVQKELELLG